MPCPDVALDARRAMWGPTTGIGIYVKHLLEQLPRVAPDLHVAAVGTTLVPDAQQRPATPVNRARRWPAKLASDLVELPVRMGSARLRHFPYTENAGRRPWVVSVHDLAVCHPRPGDAASRRYYAWRTLALARGAQAILCPSTATAGALRSVLGPGARIHLVPYGAELAPADPPADGQAPGRPYLLHPGGTAARKNLTVLLEAWDRVRPWFDGELLLTGCPETTLGLPPGARFLGRVPRPALAWLYRHATAVVYPSLEEGFGLPIVEAAALGRPVVCGPVGVVPDLPAGAALVVDQRDPGSLAEGILSAIKGWLPDGVACATVAATYSWERCARETAAVYRGLL